MLLTRLKVIGGSVAGPQQQLFSSDSGLQHVHDGRSTHLNRSDETHTNIIKRDINNSRTDILKADRVNTLFTLF